MANGAHPPKPTTKTTTAKPKPKDKKPAKTTAAKR